MSKNPACRKTASGIFTVLHLSGLPVDIDFVSRTVFATSYIDAFARI